MRPIDASQPWMLWPAGVRLVDTGRQDPTRLRLHQLVDPFRAEPLRHDHEERLAVLAAQHARVAGAVELDPIEHLTTFADTQTYTSVVRCHVAAPHGAVGVDADPVARKISPRAPVRQGPVGRDVEGGDPSS